jgi:hypothetical protein
MRYVEIYSRAREPTDNKHVACALHAVYLRLKLHTQVCNKLLCHYNNYCKNTHQCYVLCTLPVLIYYIFENHIGLPKK